MRKARDFVDDYRRKGYPDDRIKIIASMRPEPLRSEVLNVIEEETIASSKPVKADKSIHEAPTEVVATAPRKPKSAPERKAATSKNKPSAGKSKTPGKIETLRKERAAIQAELEAARKEIKRLSAKKADGAKSKKSPADVEALHKELHEMREKQRKLSGQNSKSATQIEELESALKQKDSVVAKMEKSRAEMEAGLAKERTECKAALARSAELAKDIEEHAEQLGQLEQFEEQLVEATARSEQLQAMEQAHLERIAELEADANNQETNTEEMRRQIESNEQAVSELEEKLTLRDSELESLRAHFDIEAADLKKRAEQEMWMVQRRLNRMRRITAIGVAGAACIVFLLAFGLIRTAGTASDRADEIARLEQIQSVNTVADSRSADYPGTMPVGFEPSPQPERLTPRAPLLPLEIPTDLPDPVAGEQPTTDSAVPGTRVEYYVVQKDDKLWNISREFLGSGVRWKEIARENSINVLNPEIKPGMRLRITIPADN